MFLGRCYLIRLDWTPDLRLAMYCRGQSVTIPTITSRSCGSFAGIVSGCEQLEQKCSVSRIRFSLLRWSNKEASWTVWCMLLQLGQCRLSFPLAVSLSSFPWWLHQQSSRSRWFTGSWSNLNHDAMACSSNRWQMLKWTDSSRANLSSAHQFVISSFSSVDISISQPLVIQVLVM